MKRKSWLIVLAISLVFVVSAFAQNGDYGVATEEPKEVPIKWCPTSLISDNDKCMLCHVVSGGKFVLKQTEPDAHIPYPATGKILNYGTPDAQGYFFLTGSINSSDSGSIKELFDILDKHNIKHCIIEIYSGGGELFAGWRFKGVMDIWMAKGNIIETRLLGVAASAAATVFVAGSNGYRFMNPQAELMFHELWQFKFLDIATPSDKEDEAKALRHLMDTMTSFLASRSKMTKEEIDTKVHKKEFWVNGIEAVEFGFADGFIK